MSSKEAYSFPYRISAVQGEKISVGIMALQSCRLRIAVMGVNLCWNCQGSQMTSGQATKGLLSIR